MGVDVYTPGAAPALLGLVTAEDGNVASCTGTGRPAYNKALQMMGVRGAETPCASRMTLDP